MERLSLQYIAGFMDGEGCICLHENRAYAARSANGQPRIVMAVAIANCNKAILLQIQKQFGGSICAQQVKYNPNARQSWRLKLVEQVGCRLLKAILPFLQIKRKQAKLMLQLGRRKAKDAQYLSLAETKFRKRLVRRCQALNKKGPR